eukprot:6479234-Amphidinium_carterae.1
MKTSAQSSNPQNQPRNKKGSKIAKFLILKVWEALRRIEITVVFAIQNCELGCDLGTAVASWWGPGACGVVCFSQYVLVLQGGRMLKLGNDPGGHLGEATSPIVNQNEDGI